MRRVVHAWEIRPKDRLIRQSNGQWFPSRPTVMAVDTIGGMTYVQWPGPDPASPRSTGWLSHELVTVERDVRPAPLRPLPSGAWKAMAVCAVATVLAAVAAVLSVDPLYGWVWRAW